MAGIDKLENGPKGIHYHIYTANNLEYEGKKGQKKTFTIMDVKLTKEAPQTIKSLTLYNKITKPADWPWEDNQNFIFDKIFIVDEDISVNKKGEIINANKINKLNLHGPNMLVTVMYKIDFGTISHDPNGRKNGTSIFFGSKEAFENKKPDEKKKDKEIKKYTYSVESLKIDTIYVAQANLRISKTVETRKLHVNNGNFIAEKTSTAKVQNTKSMDHGKLSFRGITSISNKVAIFAYGILNCSKAVMKEFPKEVATELNALVRFPKPGKNQTKPSIAGQGQVLFE